MHGTGQCKAGEHVRRPEAWPNIPRRRNRGSPAQARTAALNMSQLRLILCVSLALGCSDRGPTARVRDPAGDTTRRSLPIIGTLPTIAFTIPDSIGGASADMGRALRLASGAIVVADWDGHRILRFDSTGRLTKVLGRAGSGPGEFQGTALVQAIAGDSLLVWDASLRRLTWLDPQTGGSRSCSIKIGDAAGSNPIIGLLADGRLVVQHEAPGASTPGAPVGRHMRLRLMDRCGRLLGEISGDFPGGRWDARGYRFFAPTTQTATDGTRIFAGNSSAWEIVVLAPDGHRLGSLTRPWRATLVTEQDREAIRAALDRPDIAPGFLDDDRFDPTVPAFGRILPSPDGTVWVLEYAAPYQPTDSVSIFSADNQLLGTLPLPPGFRPTSVGPDYLLGTGIGEDGDFEIRLYLVRWPSAVPSP